MLRLARAALAVRRLTNTILWQSRCDTVRRELVKHDNGMA